jgi:thermitase
MMSARPTLPAATIESLLFQTALDLGSAGRDTRYGHGRVQAAAAVAAALAATTPTVDTQAPQVAIGSPAGGASVSGLVAVDVAASDNVGVTRVELLVGNTVVATDNQGPFGFVWDSSTRANGSTSLVARAFDAAGNSANSVAVVVNVANAVVPDTTAPVITVASPLAGAFYRPGVISIRASASDDRGVVSMTVAIDGATVQQQNGGSVSMNWNARKVSLGVHTVTVSARDAAGNTSTKSVVVTIQR